MDRFSSMDGGRTWTDVSSLRPDLAGKPLVSHDGGSSWETASGPACGLSSPEEGSFGAVFADAGDSRRAFALMDERMFMTEDGGSSWKERLFDFAPRSVVLDPTDAGRWYLKTDGGGFFRARWRKEMTCRRCL